MTTPEIVLTLVEKFERNQETYIRGHYNETQVRRDFIDPLFTALGWDMDNTSGYAEAYRDVIHEDAIKIGSSMRAPDYSFRIGGTRKFFLEAKKPSVNIKTDIEPAFQLRRYGWSAKLPLSILTDFEEFAVYDCRIKPDKSDKASKARLFYCNFKDLADKWDEIAAIFSKTAVLQGSFDKYAVSSTAKRGTTEVDAAFLAEIEGWRISLAKNIILRNASITQSELNFAVQQTIDRIIFLRICEDRGIEPYGRLQALTSGAGVYDRLQALFQQADDRYNSGLFHYKREKGRTEPPDELTPNLDIDDKTLKEIFKSLYYPDCPYEFSVLGAEILGSVYEQFLGKVINLLPNRRLALEDKPEVKKAGGVFYTPAYIVDYISAKTVGKLLQKKSISQAAKLRIVDPACGSGSFLIGAYQYLLDWYFATYVAEGVEKYSKGKNARLRSGNSGSWHLTTTEKKRILLEHIFGVDIDPQAVEVTKLSLLLKVLEGESAESLGTTGKLFHERVLPDLDSNIRCGNSLISSDFYDIDRHDQDVKNINVFDWADEFPAVFEEGGFSAVIGNPPYIDVKELPLQIKAELSRVYRSATQRFDLYIPFIEKGLHLLKNNGFLSYIVPSMFIHREYGRDIRKVILDKSKVAEIVDFGTNQIFNGPINYVAILVLEKTAKSNPIDVIKFERTGLVTAEIERILSGGKEIGVQRFSMPSKTLSGKAEWQLFDTKQTKLTKRLFSFNTTLGDVAKFVSEGIHSGKDEVFFVPNDKVAALQLEANGIFPLAKGKEVHRYEALDRKKYLNFVIYPYDLDTGNVISDKQLASKSPHIWKYLLSAKDSLKGRAYFDKSAKKWYELWCPRNPSLFTEPKIIGPEIANKGEFTISTRSLFANNKLKVIVLKSEVAESLEFILGLLNSKLLTYLHRLIAPPKGNNYFEVKTRTVGRLPIRKIDFTDKSDCSSHDRMVILVKKLLETSGLRATAKNPQEVKPLERQILTLERQIDELVYELYGLCDEEIAMIEGT